MLELSEDELDVLCEMIPDHHVGSKGGRPRMPKWQAIRGIFWILDNGAKWKDLPKEFGARSSVHRAFKRWVEAGVFEKMLRSLGQFIEENEGFKLYECHIEGSFSKAKGGGAGIGCTSSGKGLKTMIMVDAQGLPIAVDTGSAQPHESKLVHPLFDFMLTDGKPENPIGDKAYDSDALYHSLAKDGIEMIAPHKNNRKTQNKTHDGRPLRRYKARWTVERTIGWVQNYRRLCMRWEKLTAMF